MSFITKNQELKAELINRWLELDVYSVNGSTQRHKEITDDAADLAPWMKITSDRLSKWLNGDTKQLSEKQITWLCNRYGIEIEVDTRIKVQPYDELECLRKVKKKFPKP